MLVCFTNQMLVPYEMFSLVLILCTLFTSIFHKSSAFFSYLFTQYIHFFLKFLINNEYS